MVNTSSIITNNTMSGSTAIHLKGLNGIRAIAAFAAVFSHIRLLGEKFLSLPTSTGLELAEFGVTIFFALSGYLITYLLLIEKDSFDTINIKQFYVRRILRIWPLYYLYVLLALAYLLIYQKEQLSWSFLWYIILCANIPYVALQAPVVIIHFWSLGVEEQYYLFWPWVIKVKKHLFILITFIIMAMLGLKFLFWLYFLKTKNTFLLSLIHITRFHCMAFGAIGAMLYYQQRRLFRKVVFSWVAQAMSWGIMILVLFNRFHIAGVIDHEIIAIVTVFLIVNVSANEKSFVKLESKILNYLGKISYGIYVYHPLIILLLAQLLGSVVSKAGLIYRYAIWYSLIPVCTVLVASVSYFFYEMKFLDLKAKYTKVPSR